jgi:ribonuclease HI
VRPDRRTCRAAAAQRGHFRSCLVAGPLTSRTLATKIYFDGGCRPNPGAIRVAAVVRGAVHLAADCGSGSSGDAEWLALLHALEVALAAGVSDATLLGDSASVIDQARGVARRRLAPDLETRFFALIARFDRLRFRRIKRTQNLAGIALEQVVRRSPQMDNMA